LVLVLSQNKKIYPTIASVTRKNFTITMQACVTILAVITYSY